MSTDKFPEKFKPIKSPEDDEQDPQQELDNEAVIIERSFPKKEADPAEPAEGIGLPEKLDETKESEISVSPEEVTVQEPNEKIVQTPDVKEQESEVTESEQKSEKQKDIESIFESELKILRDFVQSNAVSNSNKVRIQIQKAEELVRQIATGEINKYQYPDKLFELLKETEIQDKGKGKLSDTKIYTMREQSVSTSKAVENYLKKAA